MFIMQLMRDIHIGQVVDGLLDLRLLGLVVHELLELHLVLVGHVSEAVGDLVGDLEGIHGYDLVNERCANDV